MTIPKFQNLILAWYKTNKRDLPWRNTKDPYRILISEIMLQQTQVTRVIPKYEEFLKAFPTLEKLAKASNKKLLKVWAGLGYWKRALNLKKAAQAILEARAVNCQTSPRRRFGTVPPAADKSPRAQTPKSRRDFEGRSFGISLPEHLEQLPGIGPYTARALACFAFQNQDAFLDTNIRRVFLHFFFAKRKKVADVEILVIAQKAVWKKNPREWHYALFDYGATVLKDKSLNRKSTRYAKQSKFEGSFRSFRTKVVRFLLQQPRKKATKRAIILLLEKSKNPYPPNQILGSLVKDNLIQQKEGSYFL